MRQLPASLCLCDKLYLSLVMHVRTHATEAVFPYVQGTMFGECRQEEQARTNHGLHM